MMWKGIPVKSELPWKLLQNLRDAALSQGEEIAKVLDFQSPPVDPFLVIKQEPLIYAEGSDFGDAFDGCLVYAGNRFLLAYNTKYDIWPHSSLHHPRVRFTIGHELGHFYLKEHREILRNGGPQYTCTTEFEDDPQMEQEADCFSAGLLMPSYMLSPRINQLADPTLKDIRMLAKDFDVSMTSMMVRWVRLSDFPCGVFSFGAEGIRWGWVSDAFARMGAFRKHKGPVRSPGAVKFLNAGALTRYREGESSGYLHDWVETDESGLGVQEFYAVIPYAGYALVFITAAEDDLPEAFED